LEGVAQKAINGHGSLTHHKPLNQTMNKYSQSVSVNQSSEMTIQKASKIQEEFLLNIQKAKIYTVQPRCDFYACTTCSSQLVF
jgi:hypothetical protein